jgi:hypothetical protein
LHESVAAKGGFAVGGAGVSIVGVTVVALLPQNLIRETISATREQTGRLAKVSVESVAVVALLTERRINDAVAASGLAAPHPADTESRQPIETPHTTSLLVLWECMQFILKRRFF